MQSAQVTPTKKRPNKLATFVAVLVSAALAAGAWLISPSVALIVSGFVCSHTSNICSIDRYGPLVFSVVAALFVTCISTLSLRFLAKTSWLTGMASALASAAAFYFIISFVLIFTFDPHATPNSALLYLELAATGLLLVAHFYLFDWLSRWPWYVAVLLCIGLISFYLTSPLLFNGYSKNRLSEQENQLDLSEAENLPFRIYAPSRIPPGYSLTSVNAYAATDDMPASYTMTYSTQPVSHTNGAKSLFVRQQIYSDYHPPQKCSPFKGPSYLEPARVVGECIEIGTTSICDVYYQSPDPSGERQTFCGIGSLLIIVTADENILKQNELVDIIGSFRPANAKDLQNESLKHQ